MFRQSSIAALVALAAFGSFTRATAQERKDSLDELLRDYREYGLPEPPKDAPLVRIDSGGVSVDADGKQTPILHLGFLLQPGDEKHPAVVLLGTVNYETQPKEGAIVKVDPNTAGLDNVRWTTWGARPVPVAINVGLTAALQCKGRGWDQLAQRLWDLSIQESSGHSHSPWYLPANQPPKTALAWTAWVHYLNELFRPKTDRGAILARMKVLISKEPKLDIETNRDLLKDLEATVVPSRAKPGTAEALIDDLVELQGLTSVFPWDESHEDPNQAGLIDLGFDAVPALIEHSDDGRLTRSFMAPLNNFPGYPRRVGHVVADILKGLADGELYRDPQVGGQGVGLVAAPGSASSREFLDRQQGYGISKARAEAWFARASKLGEEQYAVQHALPEDKEDTNEQMQILRLLAKKYPARLLDVYRRILGERPEMQSQQLAKLIARGPLIKAQKTDLFHAAAETPSLKQRIIALGELKDLDERDFLGILVKNLEALPKSARTDRFAHCPESEIARLVATTDDPRAWEALATAAARAEVKLRVEMLEEVGWRKCEASQSRKRLEFLSRFLKDETVRILYEEDEETFFRAESHFPKLEVRNFAALKIAGLLETGDEPRRDWTDKDWAAFRARIQERLSREKVALEPLESLSFAAVEEPKPQITNSIGMKLTLIPSGEFMMGSAESAEETATFFKKNYGMDLLTADLFKDEHPQHRVRITKPFYLGTYHVTRGQFRQFVKETEYRTDAERLQGQGTYDLDPERKQFESKDWRNAGFEQTDEHPVVWVNWDDAVAFCKWLSKKEGKTYRLPTEAEWEYACRAGTKTRYHSGDDPETLAKVANVADATFKARFPDCKDTIKASDGYVFTAPAGQFKPNAFGLYDMHGSAWQWCADLYGEDYYATSPEDNPIGASGGSGHVLRGGCWSYGPEYARSALRIRAWFGVWGNNIGFRVARTP